LFSHKSSLTKHQLLCDIVHQPLLTLEQESEHLSPTQWLHTLQHLIHNQHLLEKKIAILQQKVHRLENTSNEKKVQQQPIASFATPSNVFAIWVLEPSEPSADSIWGALKQMDMALAFSKFIKQKWTAESPLQQDADHRWYVFDTGGWRKMKKEDWATLCTHIHACILKQILLPWKQENKEKLVRDESLGDLLNKVVVKFMSLDVSHDTFLGKLKQELKSLRI
jgi:hypothetical protein